jgi:hypothetical protein
MHMFDYIMRSYKLRWLELSVTYYLKLQLI